MNCPFCGSSQIMVVNSRPTRGNSQIWRRRKCISCKEGFTTYGRMTLSHLIVIKKSGRRQRYSRAKIYSGIYHSSLDKKNADKGERGTFAEEVTGRVELEITKLRRKRIYSTEITEIILRILAKKEPDTLLRFLAYREGNNLKKLQKLVRKYYK